MLKGRHMKSIVVAWLLMFAMLSTGIWLADTIMASSSPLSSLLAVITAAVAVVAGLAWLPG